MEEYRDDSYFVCDDDQKAEWCLQQIEKAEAEREKWKAFYAERMERVNAQCDEKVGIMKSYLALYFATVPHKKTKTEESYRLPSGKLAMKTQAPKFEYNAADLLEYLKKNGGEQYVKVTESPDWAAYKKTLSIVGEGVVADADGQIVPCITVTQPEPEFKITK